MSIYIGDKRAASTGNVRRVVDDSISDKTVKTQEELDALTKPDGSILDAFFFKQAIHEVEGSEYSELHIHTIAEEFYGLIVTATLIEDVEDYEGDKHEEVVTGEFDNKGYCKLKIHHIGKYEVSVEFDGHVYKTLVDVPYFSIFVVDIKKGVDVKDWQTLGRCTTIYDTLEEILEDEKQIRQLFTVHASVDYLAENCDENTASTIFNNDYCAKWINLRDYALDTLYASKTCHDAMDEADKYFYGEWALMPQVPTMTSNTAPSGEVICSTYYSDGYSAYKVFDNNDTTKWAQKYKGTVGDYVGYKFNKPVIVSAVEILTHDNLPSNGTCNTASISVKASNDGKDWVTIESYDDCPTTLLTRFVKKVRCSTSYLYWVISDDVAPPSEWNVNGLQFYAWQPKGNIPVMTSNTAPYGSAESSSVYSGYEAWRAFDGKGKITAASPTGTHATGWVRYNFSNPICIKGALIGAENVDGKGHIMVKDFEIWGSNDNWDSYDIIYSNTHSQKDLESFFFEGNGKYYKSIQLFIKNYYSSYGYWQVNTLQFYGRELKVSVPVMTSNTEPWGEASAKTAYNTSSPAWKAFNGTNTGEWDGWVSSASASGTLLNDWIQYKFNKPTVVKVAYFENRYIASSDGNARIKTYKIQASNDGNVWVDLTDEIIRPSTKNAVKASDTIALENNESYLYYRLAVIEGFTSIAGAAIIQFFGLDYDEHNERHYIYDHGVEVEDMNGDGITDYQYQRVGRKATHGPNSIICTTNTLGIDYAITSNSIQTNGKKILKAVIDNFIRAQNYGGIALQIATGNYASEAPTLAAVYINKNIDSTGRIMYVDISSFTEGCICVRTGSNVNNVEYITCEFLEIYLE